MNNKSSVFSTINNLLYSLNILKKNFFHDYSKNDRGTFLSKLYSETIFKNKYKIKTNNIFKYLEPYEKDFEDYRNIIYFNHTVEYLIYFYLTYIFQKEDLKDTLFLCEDKIQTDLIDILYPDVAYQVLPLHDDFPLNYSIIKQYRTDIKCEQNFKSINLNKINQYILNNICNSPIDSIHYFDLFFKILSTSREELAFNKITPPKYMVDNLIEKMQKINLNLEKFVFISPESDFSKEYDNDFWTNLCEKLHSEGYDIFIYQNNKKTKIKNVPYKTSKLKLSEAIILSRLSKGIVSLRSSICEICIQSNVPMFCLYNDFLDSFLEDGIDVYSAFYGFALNKLPNINKENLFEINLFEETNQDVIDKIANNLQKINS